MATVSASNSEWHSRLVLSNGNNEISATGTWNHDPNRDAHGPGGNGTPAGSDYDKPAPAGEGSLLARVNGGAIEHFSSGDPIRVTGPGHVDFKMNDNRHTDNLGSLEVAVTAVS